MVNAMTVFIALSVATLLLGGNYLEYGVLASSQVAGQHLGILVIELGVGITVMAVMLIMFFAFAERGRAFEDVEDEEASN